MALRRQRIHESELIQSDPSIMMGKPVIAGARITVEFILEKLAAGETIPQIMNPAIKIKSQELSNLCLKHRVRQLAVFGSAVGEDFREGKSDLDFLVDFEKMSPHEHTEHYFELMEELENLFNIPIDLIEEEPIDNPYFRQAVEESKVVLYDAA